MTPSTKQWTVEGEPSSFLTPAEAVWKEKLKRGIPRFAIASDEGIRVVFTVAAWKRRGYYFDLDNLAKPVFDFLGRPDVPFLDLGVHLGPVPGVFIEVTREAPPRYEPVCWFEQLVRGSVRHTDAHAALAGLPKFEGNDALYVQLVLHESGSITDFDFTGFVKPTLDRLWPVIGGSPGHPNDHRIQQLLISRSPDHPTGVSVAIGRLPEAARELL